MRIEELDFSYPDNLIATERATTSRVMLTRAPFQAQELGGGLTELIDFFEPGDVLVINDTQVLARRVFSETGLEILFLEPVPDLLARDASTAVALEQIWTVLCPSARWKNNTLQTLPGGVTLELLERGRPQIVKASRRLTPDYFAENGELPLPPYIQKARDERKNRTLDKSSYQTAWATRPGSLAAPTASLHFSNADLEKIRARGVQVVQVTLHVGLGTFLPVTTSQLEDHQMHGEFAEISLRTWEAVLRAKAGGHHVWALGTTVTRTLESAATGRLAKAEVDIACEHVIDDRRAAFFGETKLFIQPGYEFKIVDRLLTNFHQPKSTLLALVAAFAGLESVKRSYAWAIELGFRLFSYGDLTVWYVVADSGNRSIDPSGTRPGQTS